MVPASSFSSPDCPDYLWSEAALALVETHINDLQSRKPAYEPSAPPGHNNPPTDSDPGPDVSYRITFPIPEWVPREQVREFERVLRDQGQYPNRLAALDQAAYRVRATSSVSHRGFRLYDGVLDISKGEHRCFLLDLDKLGFIVGIPDRANASKVLDEIEIAGLVKTLRFTEGRLGAPTSRKVLIAPLITPQDRARVAVSRVLADAEAAKRAVLEKRAEAERARYHHRNQSLPGGHGNHQKKEPLVVEATTRLSGGQGDHQIPVPSGRGDFSSGRGDHLLNHIDKPQKIGTPAAPPPEAGLGTSPGRGASRARVCEAASAADEVEQAVKLYNDAAQQHGFTLCHSITKSRRKRLRKRLDEIGGLEPFRRALSAIPRDRFLMGRKAPRSGEDPFKLTLDHLLQTEGKMGDVLARLIDQAADVGSTAIGASTSQAQSDLDDAIARLREEQDEEAGSWRD
jgi:hypothetical protein